MKRQWRTRTRGSRRQIGKKFILGSSQQKLKASLPRVSGKVRQTYPPRNVQLSLKNIPTRLIVWHEKHPVDLDRRVSYFLDMYREGRTIPPILVHQLPDGRYEVLDGHARLEAFKLLSIKNIPAVENLTLFKKKDNEGLYSKQEKLAPAVVHWKAEKEPFVKASKSYEKIPTKPNVEAQKAWKPRGYEFTEEMKARRKGAIMRTVKSIPEKIEKRGSQITQAVSKPVGYLGKIEQELQKGKPMRIEITHKGAGQEPQVAARPIAVSEVRPIHTGRERARPVSSKPFTTGAWHGGNPLLAHEAKPPIPVRKKKGKRKKTRGVWYET